MNFGDIKIPKKEFDAKWLDKAIEEGNEGQCIASAIQEHQEFVKLIEQANRYYIGFNDILCKEKTKDRVDRVYEQQITNPLRTANNQEPHSFYSIIVDQKISYGFSDRILLDSKNKKYNEELTKLANLLYGRIDYLALYSSNAGFSWLYYYINKNVEFRLQEYEASEIIPFYDYSEEKTLKYILRYFENVAILYKIEGYVKYSLDKQGIYQKEKTILGREKLNPYMTRKNIFGQQRKVAENWGRLPFIRFNNNITNTPDLLKLKPFIDAYDMIVSNYVNDVEDLQQLIFVLINYGGQNLEEFLQDLKKYKAIKIKRNGSGHDGGVETLKVDIPVEARIKLLEVIEQNIWNIGQAVNPKDLREAGKLSGVAIQQLYGLLELKTGLMIKQYYNSIEELIEAHKLYLKKAKKLDYTEENVEQIYTRTMIKNDAETIENCKNSVGIVSNKTILKNHPWVSDVEAEEKQIKKEEAEDMEYNDTFQKLTKEGEKNEESGQ